MKPTRNPDLLKVIRCPVTHSELTFADPELVDSLNQKITERTLVNRIGQTVDQSLDGGLVNADRSLLLPIRGEILVLVVDQAIPLT
jgi:uncharacterized protein YbaR (Trm112 family)